jgi:hypothetical protein
MADSNSNSTSGGIGFVGLLTIVFITLKLLGKISWPWVWVLSPLWISALLFVGFMALILGGVGLVWFLDAALDRRQFKQSRERSRIGARRTTGRVIDVERKKDDHFVN